MIAMAVTPMEVRRPPRKRSIPVGAALLFFSLLLAVGLFGPALVSVAPEKISLSDRLIPPPGFGGTFDHPFGTDELGRDVFSRVVSGARVSLLIALSSTLLAGTIGTAIGLIGGYAGGRWDRLTTWLGDVQMAIPFVVVAIGIAASFKPSALNVIVILGFTGWATYARVARLAAQPLRTAEFVQSAKVSGAGNSRVLFRHILPMILPPIVAIASQQAGAMMLYEAALSYLGLGVPGGTITWGGMIADSRETAQVAWWATVAPGLAIVFVVIGFNASGAALSNRYLGMRSWTSRA